MTPAPDSFTLPPHAVVALVAALGAIAAPPCRAQGVAPPAAAASASASASPMNHGLFTDVRVYRPAGDAQQFVLLVIAGAAPTPREGRMLKVMRDDGAMVATVPLAPFYRKLAAQDGRCTYGPGAFENLSRHLQAFEHVPGYRQPLLVGADAVSPYVYSVLAQAPAGTFAAGLVAGFSPRLALKTPPCPANALRERKKASAGSVELGPSATALPVPWIAVQDDAQGAPAAAAARAFVQRVPQAEWIGLGADGSAAAATAAFAQAYRRLALPQAAIGAPPQQLADLPIVEVPAAAPGRRFAVLLSGDGGWAGIDKSLGAAFAAQGIPVAGFDSLRYFWSRRTPDELAADLDRIIRYYAAHWGRSDVLLVGYSQGADVLPFALNRLPAGPRDLAPRRAPRPRPEGLVRVPPDELDRPERRPAHRARSAQAVGGQHALHLRPGREGLVVPATVADPRPGPGTDRRPPLRRRLWRAGGKNPGGDAGRGASLSARDPLGLGHRQGRIRRARTCHVPRGASVRRGLLRRRPV
jgi:type IV secretory pathway VirJ component